MWKASYKKVRIFIRVWRHIPFYICGYFLLISCSTNNLESLPNKMLVNMGSDEILLSSPKGYCINEATQRRHSSGFTVIFSDCFNISKNNERMFVRSPVRSLVTVTISDKKIKSDDEFKILDNLIMSGNFDALFGRNDNVENMKTIEKSKSDGVYYMCFEDTSLDLQAKTTFRAKVFCRAVFIIKDRIISLVGNDYATQYTDNGRIENLIRETVTEILSSNSNLDV